MNGKFVSYLRVSTARQGLSGLGLEAQRHAVEEYLNGGRWELLGEHVELESGKHTLAHRPVLREALEVCKRHKATLVVAKLDRLARNVAFVSALMESKVDFVAADFPAANKLTVHILAAVAEHEREQISARTRAALQAAKVRGVKLGNPRIKQINRPRRQEAHAFAETLRPTLEAYRAAGMSERGMVVSLNSVGVRSARGGQWHLQTLQRVLERFHDVEHPPHTAGASDRGARP